MSESHHIYTIGAIVMILLIILYMVLGAVIERAHCNFGHEASIVIIAGACVALIAFQLGFTSFNDALSFDHNVFFYFCLPPIVFASGFNMKRKIFFENFTSVIIFGVFSTILQFILFSIGLYCINNMGIFSKINLDSG